MTASGGPAGRGAVVTPEAVPLDLPIAGLGSRGVAYLIDAVIVGAGIVALLLAGTALGDPLAAVPTWIGVTLVLLLVFGIQLGYPIGFETLWRGRTPGKAAMGVRVVTVDGAPVGFRHAAIRAALGIVDFQLTVGLAAIVAGLSTARTQRLGDLVAGTLVLRERTGAGSAQHRSFPVPAGLEDYAARLDVTGLGPGEYQAVRSFVLRADALAAAPRRRLAEELADALAGRVSPQPPAGVSAEAWLRTVAAAYQRRSRAAAARPRATSRDDGVFHPSGWEPAGPPSSRGLPPPSPAPPPPPPREDDGGNAFVPPA